MSRRSEYRLGAPAHPWGADTSGAAGRPSGGKGCVPAGFGSDRRIRHYRRYRQIAETLIRHGFGYLVEQLELGP